MSFMRTTRRAYLAALGGGVAAVSGCLGDGRSSNSPSGGGSSGDCQADEKKVKKLPQPTLGSKGAPVTVTVFEDFSCPHCRTFTLETLPKIRSEYVEPGKARYEFYDFPIPVDQRWSWAAASAARGVQDNTDDKTYFEYAHKLYENQTNLSYELVGKLAKEVGADDCDIRTDAEQVTYEPVLNKNRQHGVNIGVKGTPGVYVDGRNVDPTWEAVRSAIESSL